MLRFSALGQHGKIFMLEYIEFEVPLKRLTA